MPDTILSLGEVDFADAEIPRSIKFGGKQNLEIHRLVGGTKVIDAMGRDDMPLEWSGYFLGSTATNRARFLDAYRVQGLPQTLSWGEFTYQVIVREFEGEYRRFYEIPYRIVCEVITDNSGLVTDLEDVDDAVSDDLDTANGLAGTIGDSSLLSSMGSLSSAIANVSSFATAAQASINAVMAPLQAAQARVTQLIASTSNALTSATTFGGLLPGNPVSQLVGSLTNAAVNTSTLNTLGNLQSVLGRMQSNVPSGLQASTVLTVGGGNLMQIASQQYGDPSAWTSIARANGLTDPVIAGTQALKIPSLPDGAGGILFA